MAQGGNEFNAIRISLASPDQMRIWSYGEVTKPETINYRTLRPEKDGLFCERIFGPTKDWECYCGKYKKIRYKGVICDRCGVEVARSKVRRERMGHIALAAPVAHIWFSKGTPSRLGLLLDLSPRNLDRVLYFAQYLVTNVDIDLRAAAVDRLEGGLEEGVEKLDSEASEKVQAVRGQFGLTAEVAEGAEVEEGAEDVAPEAEAEVEISEDKRESIETEIRQINMKLDADKSELETDISGQIDELESLSIGQLLRESRYRELRDSHGEVFRASMGAEAVLEILKGLDMAKLRDDLQEEIRSTSGQRRKKAINRLRVIEAFRKSENRPEWMVFTTLPVLPPELRPMVQLDGGRFATSDLNDLYRRVINRNNRLKRLIELQAPEIIVRNEKRMLQEAVDALVDNGRRGRAVSGSHNHKLKSLSDLLRGKQGRFRQNLLGKRVDYSGRSVIIVGPELKLHQCGLPRRMALELFKPFVMNRLVMKGYAHNIKSAKRLAERARPEVWDILEEVVKDRPVLLNRAPTLHRLGIQAFHPVLIEGSAIRLHPLVTTAFNADFDGDQMAVHVPLSREAVQEANRMMLSTYNMLAPSSGEPIVAPTLDMVLGCFYMTQIEEGAKGTGHEFSDFEDARLAYEVGVVDLRALVKIKHGPESLVNAETNVSGSLETTVGRMIFNENVPDELGYRNGEIDKDALKSITSEAHTILGNVKTAVILDAFKDLGFHYASKAGITIAINDIEISPEKDVIVGLAETKVTQLEQQYMDGLITEDERYRTAVDIWTRASDDVTQMVQDNLKNYGGIYVMAASGAKGNIAQIKQMAGMRGLMSDPKGRIIERPIKANFREGLSVLEYFLSTHGARKGLADTALRTADSGYLTRRLIDVAQEIIVLSDDCETAGGIWVENGVQDSLLTPFTDKVRGRYLAAPVADAETGEIIVDKGELLNDITLAKLQEANTPGVFARSPLACEARRGVCRLCYGVSMATWDPVLIGEAVGIIAAQSIGEPGTQLTMRTFHTGGIAGADITSGLPRVEELFEARTPKGEAVLSEIDGTVEVHDSTEGRTIQVISTEDFSDEYILPAGYQVQVSEGDIVNVGAQLAVNGEEESGEETTALASNDIIARVSGVVRIEGDTLSISWTDEDQREYVIPAASHIMVASGDQVAAGETLTAGPKNPQQILRIQGREAVQQYLIEEVQKVYRSQGVTIHNKHIEVIISQMLRKVRIDSPGDTGLLPGELVDRQPYEDINAGILAEGGEPATASPVLLGITRASLNMESFLAAASFQETTRVLTEAAVNGQVDYLRGLKENVIIGRLIPARLDGTVEGRKYLGIPEEPELEPIGILSNPLDGDGFQEGESGEIVEDQIAPAGFDMEKAVEETPVGDD
ncbi:MAG: DNA-directed RNA polymerase subunit beta' [SAR202 cluster bacterium Casp-Chloro-G4]|nr:DNA-directed RNA polymerase subunit beta' [Chloroflexota bacterium]MDA1227312.1 DNA-directed RNA polymerase subunit beta' [Chloroflexota bacterium]PKB61149.1 MAG: DNA-directed RNA polymerase subunit beta' [SAR202 cluster bacterium Casp-Chloro-G4]